MNTLDCDVKHEKFTLMAGRPFLVMEYIPKNLYRFVEDHKTPESQGLPKSQVWTIGKGMASGLMYLHTLNPPISHRDLKPDNILVMIIIYYIYLYMRKAYPNNNIWILMRVIVQPLAKASFHNHLHNLVLVGHSVLKIVNSKKESHSRGGMVQPESNS